MDERNILAVEIGNAETVLGLFAGDRLLATWHAATRADFTPDEAIQVLWTFQDVKDVPAPHDAIVCSVVPALTAVWVEALRTACGQRPPVVGPGLKSGIAMAYKDPGQIGGDRVACAVAAKARYGAPVAVVDFGSATSITVVDEKGTLLGGTISLGVRAAMEALGGSAAQLVEADLSAPRQVVARTTSDAIRAGVVLGEALKADGLIEAIWDELGYRTALIATGAYAHAVCGQAGCDFEICDDLALYGLREIYALNRR